MTTPSTPVAQPAQPLQYINADIPTLLKVFSSHTSVQSFINWIPQWAPQKEKWLKRPIQNISNPFEHLTLHAAASKSTSLGLVCNQNHPLIAIDIDGVSLDTPSIAALLKDYPTYVESSPSGKPNHYRLLYSLPSNLDKEKLKRKGTAIPQGQPNALELYNASSNFVTLTGKHVPQFPLRITEIPATIITDLFPEFSPSAQTNVIDIKTKQPQQPQQLQQPNMLLVPSSTWIREVPCDRSDPALLTFLSKHSLIYHDYWLLGLMAIQAAYGSIQGFPIADAWSKNSDIDYDSAELTTRWESISDPHYEPPLAILPRAHSSITAGTYQWMFNEFSIHWPVLNGKTKIPKPDELENFQAFLAYKGLTLELDAMTNVPFLDGEDYAVYPTYYSSREESYSIDIGDMERLAILLVLEAQPYKFRPTSAQVYTWLKGLLLTKKKAINRFAREVAHLPPYNPSTEPDFITIIGRDIIQRNTHSEAPTQEFHELLVRKWLLSLGRNLWPEIYSNQATSEGVLILSSPLGGINKSSFGVRLFPPEWRHLHVTTKPRLSAQFEDKDSVMKTIGKLVVDFDEAERIFSHNDVADLKAYLTKQFDLLRSPYGRDVQKHTRFFSCMASTNLTDLVFPREGARRYWWLNVSYVDTYAMDKMNMYNLWRQILYELSNTTGQRAPYILTATESRYLESYLSGHTTTNAAEEILNDLYDFSDEGFAKLKTNSRAQSILGSSQSITDVFNVIVANSPSRSLSQKQIKHAVVNMMKQHAPDFYINGILIKGGCYTLRRQNRYFMPALRNIALIRAADEELS